MRFRSFAAAALAAALAVAATLPVRSETVAARRIVLGRAAGPDLALAPLALAAAMGFLAEEGLEVEIAPVRTSAALLAQVAGGKILIGYCRPETLVAAHERDRKDGPPLRFFYNLVRAPVWELAALTDGPVATAQDLKGRAIGVGALAFGNVPQLRSALRALEIDPEQDVALVAVGVGASAVRALLTGRVAALHLLDLHRAQFEEAGTRLRRLELPAPYATLFAGGFLAHRDALAGEAKALAGFGRAVAKGTVACEANPRACLLAFWQRHPEERPDAGSAEDQIATGLSMLVARLGKLLAFPADEPRRFGAYPPQAWAAFLAAMRSAGQISDAAIEPESLYSDGLTDAFNAFDAAAVAQAARALP